MPVVVDLPKSAIDTVMTIRVHVASVRVATGLREADGDRQLAVATPSGLPGAGTCRRAAGVAVVKRREEAESTLNMMVYVLVLVCFIIKV